MEIFHLTKDRAKTFLCGFSYGHNRKRSALSAFEITENSRLFISVPRVIGASRLYLDIFDEGCTYIKTLPFVWGNLSDGYDEYSVKINLRALGTGLYFMRPRIFVGEKELYSHRRDDGLVFDEDENLTGLLQLLVSDFKYDPPREIYGGIIYHVFVDRFNRGGRVQVSDTARIIDGVWESIPEYPAYRGAPLKNNTFYGGTLYGIKNKLDYIASLGVTAIYLSPIFSSVSNHKYDTADYMHVDEMFGGDKALKALISAAKRRGINIILDGVFNHTGDDSIYFNRYLRYDTLGAYQSKDSPFYSWYDFREHPDKYTSWWGIDILPRINPDNPDCGDYFVGDGGVIDKYSRMGIFGLRLDVADELSDEFIGKIKSRLSSNNSPMLYGEVWEDASNKLSYGKRKRYYQGSELDGVMNYPIRQGIIDFLLGVSTERLSYALSDVMFNAPKRVRDAQMNLLGTHDTERILTVLGTDCANSLSNDELAHRRLDERCKSVARARLLSAYTILATLPGVPSVFYGDEAGLEGYHDPFNRMPYPWGREDAEILSHYRRIGEIRSTSDVYRDGEFELVLLTPELLIFKRYKGRSVFITAVNNSPTDITLTFSKKVLSQILPKRSANHSLAAGTSEIYKSTKGTILTVNN